MHIWEVKMASRDVILLLVVSFHFYYPLGNNLPSVHLPENVEGKQMDNQHSTSIHGGGNGIAHRSNFASAFVGGRGGGGGRPVGSGEEGNGGSSSTTPNTGGGAAVIPIYAGAGAANSHRNNYHHHSAGSCIRSCVGLPTFCALISAFRWFIFM